MTDEDLAAARKLDQGAFVQFSLRIPRWVRIGIEELIGKDPPDGGPNAAAIASAWLEERLTAMEPRDVEGGRLLRFPGSPA